MRKVKFWFECGRLSFTEEVEVEDDTTDEQLQSMLDDWVGNHYSAGWSEGE